MRRLSKIVSTSICLFSPTVASANIAYAAITAYDLVQSARANGMGGCVVANVDEEAALYNPGAMGVFHLNRALAVTIPIQTALLPELTDEIRVSALSISGRIPRKWIGKKEKAGSSWALSAAISQLRMRWPSFARWDGTPAEYSDRSSNFTVAAGFERSVRIGIGITYKYLKAKSPEMGAGSQAGEPLYLWRWIQLRRRLPITAGWRRPLIERLGFDGTLGTPRP